MVILLYASQTGTLQAQLIPQLSFSSAILYPQVLQTALFITVWSSGGEDERDHEQTWRNSRIRKDVCLMGPREAAGHHSRSDRELCIQICGIFGVMRPQLHSVSRMTLECSRVAWRFTWQGVCLGAENLRWRQHVSREGSDLCSHRWHGQELAPRPERDLGTPSEYTCVALHAPQTYC